MQIFQLDMTVELING